jgi:AcrR family transcriptional regulator
MPYPTQVTREQIILTARDLLERHGYDSLSLAKLAEALGIKAPSLYKHVSDKAHLLMATNAQTLLELTQAMQTAVQQHATPPQQLLAMAHAYRAYALSHPVTYELAFSNTIANTRPDASFREALALPLQAVWAQWVGEEHALVALRGSWALVHGFVILEIGQHFERGGDLEATFTQTVTAYIAGQRPTP